MTIWLVVILSPNPLERGVSFRAGRCYLSTSHIEAPGRTLPSNQKNFHQEQHASGLEGAYERAGERWVFTFDVHVHWVPLSKA